MLLSLCLSRCLLRLVLPSPSSTAEFFQFLDTVLREKFRRILSDTRIKTFIKNRVYKNFNLRYLISSIYRTSMQIFLFQIFLKLNQELIFPPVSQAATRVIPQKSCSEQCYDIHIKTRGVATNSELGGRFKSGLFLHRVNNIKHNIKQNIYTGMAVISHIAPFILHTKPARIKM